MTCTVEKAEKPSFHTDSTAVGKEDRYQLSLQPAKRAEDGSPQRDGVNP